jgi:type II secretory pathway pseudopilin PulG
MPRQWCRGTRPDAGFTVAEILVAISIITVALTGLLTAMTFGMAEVDAARLSTTALFLAEQRLEHVRSFAASANAGQGWANTVNASFGAEAYGSIAGYPSHRRTVNIVDNPGGVANTKQVQVTVFYRPVTSTGRGGETSVALSTLLVNR